MTNSPDQANFGGKITSSDSERPIILRIADEIRNSPEGAPQRSILEVYESWVEMRSQEPGSLEEFMAKRGIRNQFLGRIEHSKQLKRFLGAAAAYHGLSSEEFLHAA